MKLKTKSEDQQPKAPLHVRVRPEKLDDVIGQDAVVKALKKRDPDTHSYLFAGPSGTGKTTLGRIVAKGELIEVDAATNTGIDAMRSVMEIARSPSVLNPGGKRTILVDECHRLSGNTWDSLLKIVEEPPAHLYWVFCTTNIGKVPKTIISRCEVYTTKEVPWQSILDHLEDVILNEGINVGPAIAELAAKKAEGSVRQAINYLAVLNGIKDKDEALELMKAAEERKEVIDFIRYLAFSRDRSWGGAIAYLKVLKEQDVDAESIRIVTVNYLSACVMGAKNERDAQRLLHMLSAFCEPYPTTDKYGPLLLSMGNVLFTSR